MSENLLQYNGSKGNMIELVIANSDSMASGAIKALQENGYNLGTAGSVTIPVFGVDASDTGRQLISQGIMAGTVSQDPDETATCICSMVQNAQQGRDLLDGLDSYARDEKNGLDRKIYIPCSIYVPETEGEASADGSDGSASGSEASDAAGATDSSAGSSDEAGAE